MDAIKTEYHLTMFNSKCEAQFAYMLDHSCLGMIGWDYEPNGFCLKNGYIIDFIIFLHRKIILIEYKPTKPTGAYYENFKNNVRQFDLGMFVDYVAFALVYGNVYEGGIFQYSDDLPNEKIYLFSEQVMKEAKEHRFDLS